MPAPTQIAIATSSVNRLLKEESTYHKEEEQQKKRIEKLEQEDNEHENADYQLKQERRALEETRAIFPELKKRIRESAEKLQRLLDEAGPDGPSPDEIANAEDALKKADDLKK